MPSITAHGATLTVSDAGVQVVRTPMGQTLLPAIFDIPAADLRGWYLHAPTDTSPGWIQFSLLNPPIGAVARPIRGYPATHGVSTVVAFAPGQMESFTTANTALNALQGGYRVEASSAIAEEASNETVGAGTPQDPLLLFEVPTTVKASGTTTTPTNSTSSTEKKKPNTQRNSGWRRVSTPDSVPEPDLTADADGAVFGQNVTITGDFDPYDKGDVWDMIAAAGGTIGKNVTKKTTMLILGDWGSVTSKEKRARELVEKGQNITIWTLNEFLAALGKAPRPAFSEVKGTDAPF